MTEASVRLRNRLKEMGITSWEQASHRSPMELLRHRGFGRHCLMELRELLFLYGLHLREDSMDWNACFALSDALPEIIDHVEDARWTIL